MRMRLPLRVRGLVSAERRADSKAAKEQLSRCRRLPTATCRALVTTIYDAHLDFLYELTMCWDCACGCAYACSGCAGGAGAAGDAGASRGASTGQLGFTRGQVSGSWRRLTDSHEQSPVLSLQHRPKCCFSRLDGSRCCRRAAGLHTCLGCIPEQQLDQRLSLGRWICAHTENLAPSSKETVSSTNKAA